MMVAAGSWLVPGHDRAVCGYVARRLVAPYGPRERARAALGRLPRGRGLASGEREACDAVREKLAGSEGLFLHSVGLERDFEIVVAAPRPRRPLLAFVFAPAASAPRAVLKVGRPDAPIEAERRALERAAEGLGPDSGMMPRILAWTRSASGEAMLLDVLAGTSVWVEMHRAARPSRLYAAHLLAAAGWLGQFYRAMRRGAMQPSHGDFWPRNLILDGRKAAAVDWEHASEAGDPRDDLFHFLVSYVLAAREGPGRAPRPADAFARGFIASGELSEAVGAALAAWCRETGWNGRGLRHDLSFWLGTASRRPRDATHGQGEEFGAILAEARTTVFERSLA